MTVTQVRINIKRSLAIVGLALSAVAVGPAVASADPWDPDETQQPAPPMPMGCNDLEWPGADWAVKCDPRVGYVKYRIWHQCIDRGIKQVWGDWVPGSSTTPATMNCPNRAVYGFGAVIIG
jgi:hypothetical protein